MTIDPSLPSLGSGTVPWSPKTPTHSPEIKTAASVAVTNLQRSSGDAPTSSSGPGCNPPPPRLRRPHGLTPSTALAREKNRIAAKKCRRKKIVEERILGERKKLLHAQHVILQEAADYLVDEVLMLKHEILHHAGCGFIPIDNYIAHAANETPWPWFSTPLSTRLAPGLVNTLVAARTVPAVSQ